MARQSVIKIVEDLKKFIDNRINAVQNSLNYKLKNIRIGEDNIAANAVTARTIAAESIDTYHLKTNIIDSQHLSIRAQNLLSYPNRNYIKNSDYNVLSNSYLIHEYETSELIHDLDYTIVVFGLVNEGQQIMVKFNDGEDGTDAATFDSNGYAIIHTHTPDILENTNVRFYNYPEETATIASIGWVCMYRGNLENPSIEWNIAPEDLGEKVAYATTNISILGGEISAMVSKDDIHQYINWDPVNGVVLGRVPNPGEVLIDAQLQPNVLNFRRGGVPVAWIGQDGFNVNQGRVVSALAIGNCTLRQSNDGGFLIT